jgi:hypothetical protein
MLRAPNAGAARFGENFRQRFRLGVVTVLCPGLPVRYFHFPIAMCYQKSLQSRYFSLQIHSLSSAESGDKKLFFFSFLAVLRVRCC